MRPKVLQVLRAMWDGFPLELDGYTLYLLDREDGRGKCLVFEATRSCGDVEEKVYLGYDVPFNDFLVMLEEIPDEAVTVMCANAVLTQINREGGPSRLRERR